MEEENFWDAVDIYDPCLTWEQCDICCLSEIFIYDDGKAANLCNVCDCGNLMYTVIVFACSN